MGEDLERKRRRNEKRLRDKKLQEILTRKTLFSNAPETYLTLFRCEGSKNRSALSAGDPLLIRDNGRGRLEVLKSGLSVGFLRKADSDGLKDIMTKEKRVKGMCLGEVASLPTGDSTFCVNIRPINPAAGSTGVAR